MASRDSFPISGTCKYYLNDFFYHFSSFEIFRMVLFFRFDFLVIVSATLALIIESSYESCK